MNFAWIDYLAFILIFNNLAHAKWVELDPMLFDANTGIGYLKYGFDSPLPTHYLSVLL